MFLGWADLISSWFLESIAERGKKKLRKIVFFMEKSEREKKTKFRFGSKKILKKGKKN